MNEQVRPCVFLMSKVLSPHSKRHEHTGENEQPNKNMQRGTSTLFEEKDHLIVQLHFFKHQAKMVVQKKKRTGEHEKRL